MSQWKITFQYTDDEGRAHSVTRSDKWQPGKGLIGEYECIALDFAFVMMGIEGLGICAGCCTAEEVANAFSEIIYDNWPKSYKDSACESTE